MIHRFGTFEFDAESGELRKNGRIIALEPQPARLRPMSQPSADGRRWGL